MNARLFALLTNEVEDISLVMLSHAITHARRRDEVLIHRAFVRSQGGHVVRAARLSD